jgi:hypothetical protein
MVGRRVATGVALRYVTVALITFAGWEGAEHIITDLFLRWHEAISLVRLLLRFDNVQTGRPPPRLKIEDLNAEMVGEFFIHIESKRRNCTRSRNTRVVASWSVFPVVANNPPDPGATFVSPRYHGAGLSRGPWTCNQHRGGGLQLSDA